MTCARVVVVVVGIPPVASPAVRDVRTDSECSDDGDVSRAGCWAQLYMTANVADIILYYTG